NRSRSPCADAIQQESSSCPVLSASRCAQIGAFAPHTSASPSWRRQSPSAKTAGGQSETPMTETRAAFDRATLAFLFVLVAVTAARIVALFYIPLGLYFDEAQYWAWSRSFEWGYFTKPPLIAWVIGATTFLAGTDAEWAVRLGAPI